MKNLNQTQKLYVDTILSLNNEATLDQLVEATGKNRDTIGKYLSTMVNDDILSRGSRKKPDGKGMEITYVSKITSTDKAEAKYVPDDIEPVQPKGAAKAAKKAEPVAEEVETGANIAEGEPKAEKGSKAPKKKKDAPADKKTAKADKPAKAEKPAKEKKAKNVEKGESRNLSTPEDFLELKMKPAKKTDSTTEPIEIAARYKGKMHKALYQNGEVNFGGKTMSPTAAWTKISGNSGNGWFAWYFVNKEGNLQILDSINPKKAK